MSEKKFDQVWEQVRWLQEKQVDMMQVLWALKETSKQVLDQIVEHDSRLTQMHKALRENHQSLSAAMIELAEHQQNGSAPAPSWFDGTAEDSRSASLEHSPS